MHKKIITFVLCVILLILNIFSTTYAAGSSRVNPSREELEKKIEEVARRRGIPSVILKSIARVESVFKQYNSDGSVYTGRNGSIGLMQINNRYGWFDTNKLKYDIEYNIEAGADVLLMKWDMANSQLPKIGDMNPNILEHWYFALWAYNGWAESNNPNMIPYKYRTWTKNHTYQQLIYMVAEKEYGQKITPIDPNLLPEKGLPSKDMHFETPQDYHYGDIVMYYKGDNVKVDTNNLTLRNEPAGETIGSFNRGIELEILEEPVLRKGYFWYKVKEIQGDRTGWVARNWIVKIVRSEENSDKEDSPSLVDVNDSEAKDYINMLHQWGIITGDKQGRFYPDRLVTREEMAVFFARALGLKDSKYELQFDDVKTISPWAAEYIKAISEAGIVGGFEDNTFRPNRYVTRQEVAVIIARILNEDMDKEILNFDDSGEISPWAREAVGLVCYKGLMEIKDGSFKPKEYMTRGDIAKVVYKLMSYRAYA